MDLIAESRAVLAAAGYDAFIVDAGDNRFLAFEDATVLGFVFGFDNSRILLDEWERRADRVLKDHKVALTRANKKAWNVYTVFLSLGAPSARDRALMVVIEENLIGTRKVVRSVNGVDDLKQALLPLLPFQANPRLEKVSLESEIRLRGQALPARVLDAFLSGEPESQVLPVLEEEP